VELRLLVLRDELEELGYSEAEIDLRAEEERKAADTEAGAGEGWPRAQGEGYDARCNAFQAARTRRRPYDDYLCVFIIILFSIEYCLLLFILATALGCFVLTFVKFFSRHRRQLGVRPAQALAHGSVGRTENANTCISLFLGFLRKHLLCDFAGT